MICTTPVKTDVKPDHRPNKSQHIKLTLKKNIFSRRSCRDSNSQPFDHESGALTSKLSRLPGTGDRDDDDDRNTRVTNNSGCTFIGLSYDLMAGPYMRD